MSRRRYYRRRFLNRRGHHAGAHIIASVNVDRPCRKNDTAILDAELSIADCNRIVDLDFYAHNAASMTNVLYKARLLRDVVNGFVDAVEEAAEEIGLERRP